MAYKDENLTDQRRDEIMFTVQKYQSLAESGNADLQDRIAINRNFKVGNQWDPFDEEHNRLKKKFSLTVPIIRPFVMDLVGQVAQSPRDITLVNHHGGMKILADLQTALIKHCLSDEAYRFESVHWFEDGVTTSSGQLGVFLTKTRDPLRGDLEIRTLRPEDVLWDPTCCQYDPNTPGEGAQYVIWSPWMDRNLVAKLYPELSDRLATPRSRMMAGMAFVSSMVNRGLAAFGLSGKDSTGTIQTSGWKDFTATKVQLSHCWWLEAREVWYAYDLRTEDALPILLIDSKDRAKIEKAMKEYPGVYEIKDTVTQVLNHTIYCDGVLLEHQIDELNLTVNGMTMFPIVPFYPYFDNGYASTIVDDLIGTQKLINVARSQSLNILNSQANRQWLVKAADPARRAWLKAHGNEDGEVIVQDEFGGAVSRIDAVPFPSGMEGMIGIAKDEARFITNIRKEAPDIDKKRMSGYALSLLDAQSKQGTSGILLNFDHSTNMLGTLVRAAICGTDVYTDGEIARVIEEKNLLDPKLLDEARVAVSQATQIPIPQVPQVNKAELATMPPEEREDLVKTLERTAQTKSAMMAKIDEMAKPMAIKALIGAMRNVQAGRYYASVATSPSSPTARLQRFQDTLEMAKVFRELGIMLPPETILEASDLPGKEKLLAKMGVDAA